MRKFAVSIVSVLIAATPAMAPAYPLDGFDETGNGSSGALIGGTSCACGVRDSAMSLDGDGDALFRQELL